LSKNIVVEVPKSSLKLRTGYTGLS